MLFADVEFAQNEKRFTRDHRTQAEALVFFEGCFDHVCYAAVLACIELGRHSDETR